MPKSIGNVYYPEDLFAKDYRSDHMRFFMIYGHYRTRRNFTFEKLAEASQKLNQFKSMVQDMQAAQSADPSPKAKNLADSIVSSFERHMNEDLDVKAAFDALNGTVVTLHGLAKKGKLSAEDASAAVNGLRRVDSVLQVIF
jgi:cysteinyl-tRNA synthetase